MKKDTQHRKFQLTINNPNEHGVTHEEIQNRISSLKAVEYFCMADEIGTKKGTLHTHVFVCFSNPKLFSTIKNKFPEAHIEAAKGSCQENKDYIQKSGKWARNKKSETSLPGTFYEWGDLPTEHSVPTREYQIFEEIQEAIDSNMTPREIMAIGVYMIKYERIIKKAFYEKRCLEIPYIRKVTVYYHVGLSGSGKSYKYVQLCEELGEDSIYFMTDYANGGVGGLDGYNGEPILFMDEFKSSLPYGLLLTLLDEHKADIHCRYGNVKSLWSEVHITSIFPPEELYRGMVSECNRHRDSIYQFLRRINFVIYHKKISDNEYFSYPMAQSEYCDYEQLKNEAEKAFLAEKFGMDVKTVESWGFKEVTEPWKRNH